ncbi:iron ABC transporter permease [Pseudomonas kuykendallii]|uniref:Iron complex transport system permease protein n=1 Tax=Pseudomonas kuykendallii TaxID=1007099 RepID=A0A1H3C5W7_9PSED|nr:iron ABC transporter permease [Pseudomonas kuykendallii]MCQ4269655.1 iron ABC transporter permease [Pseudomonas kuykendallii]SDX49288.1 iron complex transport system permease protein [Pseudomonas kuykendallii]
MKRFAPGLLNLLLLAALALSFLLSLRIGPVPLTLGEVGHALLRPGAEAANLADVLVQQRIIVNEIRLPRVLLAILVGMSLGTAGAAMQGLLRNPLAEPGLLGVSSSASLGAVLCLYYGVSALSPWLVPASAMGCAALATLVLYGIARQRASNLTLILCGVALSSLAAAATSLAINLAPNPTDMQDIVLWLMGSLSDRSFADIRLCLPFIAAGLLLLFACGPQLDALTLGEDEASSLGVNLPRLRVQIILGTALCVGASVAVTGSIGFVGLVVPHLLRKAVGYHPSRLLFSSALGGALLLLAADIVLRLVSGEQELMLGVVTAMIGAPFFLALVLRQRRGVP